ncbi:MAG: ATP synthase F1 subunit delta [Rhodothermales bacterium]|nr:ATP synthase F1 subunit delta [Rhodothermales bacterium]
MSQTIARRYARALYAMAEQEASIDRVDADVAMIQESFGASSELARFFADPILSAEKKRAVIATLFGPRVHAVTARFLALLVEKRREYLFLEVARSYRALRDDQMNVVQADARVALPLEVSEEKQLRDALERLTGRTVRLKTHLDPTILGGVVIRVGDTVYDRSVLNQLSQLRDQLEQRKLSTN